jgi:glutathione S-transferase
MTVERQPFLGGEAPNYADYTVFGGFMWARGVSPYKLLEDGDPVTAWRRRLLEAFDGVAGKSLGFPV